MFNLDLDLTAKILIWMISGGGAGAAAFWLWGKIETYHQGAKELPGELKRWIALIVGAVLAVLAFLCMAWFGLVVLPITPQSWVNTIVALIGVSYITSQKLHARIQLSKQRKEALRWLQRHERTLSNVQLSMLSNALGGISSERNGPADWVEIFRSSMNEFYDYQAPELTVPVNSVPLWEHDKVDGRLDRPEYDRRSPPHTYSPPFAAGMFSMHTTMEAAIVFEVDCLPGDSIRAHVKANGIDSVESQLGLRLGIATAYPGAGAIEVDSGEDGKFTGHLASRAIWGDWYDGLKDDEWDQLWTPIVTAVQDQVWILCQARKDYREPGHSHWDSLVVEAQRGSVTPPPPNGSHAVRTIVYLDDEAVHDVSTEVRCRKDVSGQICVLAGKISSLACPES